MNKFLVKKIAFFILLIAFFIIATGLLIDAQGFRFDFKTKQFVKVGGINVKSVISDVNVYINNEHKGKTNTFSKEILIQKLIPGEYNIKIEKENYYSWEKTLKVEAQKVTKAENVYLFQKNITFEIKKENINNLFLSENKQNIIYLTNNQEIIFNNNIVLNSNNSKKYFKSIENIEFFPENKLILIKGKNNLNKDNYYYLDLTKANVLNKLVFLETATNFYLTKESIIYQKNQDIIIYSLNTKTTTILRKEVNLFAFKDDTLYSVENNILIKINNNEEAILSEKEISIKNYKLYIISGKIFAYDNSSLYLFNDYKKEFEFFLKTPQLSYDVLPDKIIFNTGSELWLLLLRDFDSPFFKKAGSLIFLSRVSSKIENITWFNNDYFFYTNNNNIFVSEIDNRNNINAIQLSNLPVIKLWFNEKILYLLSDDKVYSSSKFNNL
ncbi:MAG: PEGA domain-containing protein [Candidatus Pacebacteria bacterium]|nr:PEGA domain-containing protein [Candidatus Paceibacterota bacterium]MDD5013109.1 PEGA domain-containing protein [Candidatus Paceibacterota bacterium]MDD5752647.1 PEGA domain-containing protein [Candidatus Paceibacterota bacterium]